MADDKTFEVRYIGGLADVELEHHIVTPGETVEVSEDTAARVSQYDDWELVDSKQKPKASKPQAPKEG